MKKMIKDELHEILEDLAKDYKNAKPEDKKDILTSFVKGITTAKEIESSAVENSIKRKKIKVEQDKLDLDKEKFRLDEKKLDLDERKMSFEERKLEANLNNEVNRLDLDRLKLDFEKQKFERDLDKAKADKIFAGVMKGLEVGIPLVVYAGLSVFSLKAIYMDDVRVPSETWSFIRSVSKK